MKNKETLSKKLKGYSLVASSILASAVAADAQVIYMDVNPDLKDSHDFFFYLDLNNDGSKDFGISGDASSSYWGTSVFVYAGGFWSNCYIASVSNLPGVFDEGDTINSVLSWGGINGGTMAGDVYSQYSNNHDTLGNWIDESKKYLALRFVLNGELHYGWARLSVLHFGAYFDVTVYDYAYEATANTLIKAGDIGCVVFYADEDSDQYGDASAPAETLCELPDVGYSTVNTDCDDANTNVYPGAPEIANNGIDDDCDGYIDEFGVGISNPDALATFNIYPNPADGSITITISTQLTESLGIKILDFAGRELYSENIDNVSGTLTKQLDLSSFSSGTYLLEVIHNGEQEIKKLLIQK